MVCAPIQALHSAASPNQRTSQQHPGIVSHGISLSGARETWPSTRLRPPCPARYNVLSRSVKQGIEIGVLPNRICATPMLTVTAWRLRLHAPDPGPKPLRECVQPPGAQPSPSRQQHRKFLATDAVPITAAHNGGPWPRPRCAGNCRRRETGLVVVFLGNDRCRTPARSGLAIAQGALEFNRS